MKIKLGHVTNSSSTGYIVENVSETDNLTARAFVDSIWPHIFDEMKYYDFNYNKDTLIKSVEEDGKFNIPLAPGEEREMIWGDDDGSICGRVFDYCLRDGICTGLVNIEMDQLHR